MENTRALTLLKENWTWAAPALYVYITAIGMILSWAQFHVFHINIFEFAELNDFLLAAFRQPGALIGVITLSLYLPLMFWLGDLRVMRIFNRFVFRLYAILFSPMGLLIGRAKYKKCVVKFYRFQLNNNRYISRLSKNFLFFIFIFVSVPVLFANIELEAFKQTTISSKPITVTVKSKEPRKIESLTLIGTTERFAFFCDKIGKVIIIPISSIEMVTLVE